MTRHSIFATIPTAAARGPMAMGRVAGFHEGTQDERLDQSMGGCRVTGGKRCVGWRTAAVSGDGTGYAGSLDTTGNMGQAAGAE